MKNGFRSAAAVTIMGLLQTAAWASPPATAPDEPPAAVSTEDARYGPLGLFDHRSSYGKGVFPEPFLVDDSDLEINEFRLDWSHLGGKGQNANTMTTEVEKGFGLLTLEVEVHYDYDTFTIPGGHGREQGFDNVDVGARYPIYQYVSNDEFIDTTFGVAIEVGIPTNSPLSKNTEIVPKIFNDLRIGEHFTLQTIIGYSFLRGSGDEGGDQSFEYGMVFGWTVPHSELPLPKVDQLIPVFELSGSTLLNTHGAGTDNLVGDIAFRANLESIGRIQPRLGVGYVFPIDQGARADFHWGIYTSLVFEF
ncbi:MAG TPA: hypothetical protein VG326_07820 [Tepidisphaeraceae bacterium]|jgi:hypothetical protein|nr:hypothetical protein [Tepidisphaeraceae bacterium]